MNSTFDFVDAVKELRNPSNSVGPGELGIWGGDFGATEAASMEETARQFVEAWDLTRMPYRIGEYVDRIVFGGTEALPPAHEFHLLERARIFGGGGDLSLRRDCERFLWNFVGVPDARIPTGFGGRDFWVSHPQMRLCRHDEQALLWGEHLGKNEHGDEVWHDDRVARAMLIYPHAPSSARTRVEIRYTVLANAGQPAFVWWKELSDHG